MQEDLSANYIVVNDINASCTVNWNNGQGFNPVGTYDYYQANLEFTGSFDGQNHTISNLSINRLYDDYVGLFGAIGAGGEVKNVGVINVNITGSGNKVGGLVGDNYGTVSNSYSTGKVSGKKMVGGLVGKNKNGTVSNSYSTVNVTGGRYVGGLVGENENGNISNSNSTGNVTGSLGGGLVGYNSNGNISNSYSTGNVSGGQSVGGLVGRNWNGNISNSYSTGNVSGKYTVGGLVGQNDDESIISNSYSTGNVSGGSYVGSLVGDNDESIISNSYSTGNVTGNERLGGLVGDNDYGNISNSYWNKDSTGQSWSSSGANGLTTSEMQGISASSNMNFDFTSTWSTVEGDYPELQWQE
jgi:hypothetical protein